MQAIATLGNTAPTEKQFDVELFDSFINWIDKPEKTTRTYLINFRQFAAWLAYTGIKQPKRKDIISYRDYLTKEHTALKLDATAPNNWTYRTDSNGNRILVTCTANTIKQYLRVVCMFFSWTAANGYYPNIAEGIRAPKISGESHKRDFFTPEAVLKIETAINRTAKEKTAEAGQNRKDTKGRTQRAAEQGKRLNAIYLLAVNNGLRTIEISRAKIKDLEVMDGKASMMIWGKGHSEADSRIALAPEVYTAIKDYLESRTDKYTKDSPLFVATGNRSAGRALASTTISTMLKDAMKTAGYDSPKLTAHSLRHTAAQGVLEITGENIHKAQKYLRHESPVTTEIYLHETKGQQEERHQIAQSLYGYYHGTAYKNNNLLDLLPSMTAEQIEQLTNIARAMKA